MSIPVGTPGLVVKNKARGFSAPVRTRVDDDDDDLLPLNAASALINHQTLPAE